MDCPKCIGKLQTTKVYRWESTGLLHGGKRKKTEIEVDQCAICNGIWFDAGELETYLRRHMVSLDSPGIAPDVEAALDVKKVECPKCKKEMARLPAPKDHRVNIDFCPACRGIWLDSEEIDRIEKKNVTILEKVSTAVTRIYEEYQRCKTERRGKGNG